MADRSMDALLRMMASDENPELGLRTLAGDIISKRGMMSDRSMDATTRRLVERRLLIQHLDGWTMRADNPWDLFDLFGITELGRHFSNADNVALHDFIEWVAVQDGDGRLFRLVVGDPAAGHSVIVLERQADGSWYPPAPIDVLLRMMASDENPESGLRSRALDIISKREMLSDKFMDVTIRRLIERRLLVQTLDGLTMWADNQSELFDLFAITELGRHFSNADNVAVHNLVKWVALQDFDGRLYRLVVEDRAAGHSVIVLERRPDGSWSPPAPIDLLLRMMASDESPNSGIRSRARDIIAKREKAFWQDANESDFS